jgi:hypothetical protein
MRLLCFLFLLAVGAAITVFVLQNEQQVALTFFNQVGTAPVVVVAVAYGVGMLTGWSVVGLLRRSFERATDFRDRREPAQVR